MAVCPVYQITSREFDAPRGRLALLETMADAVGQSHRFEEILSRCLMCGACAKVCANSVETTSVIQKGRHRVFEQRKGLRASSLLAGGIREEELSGKILSKGGALLQALFCKTIPESSGLHLRFPLRFFTQRQTMPPISWTSFMREFQGKTVTGSGEKRVGFFVGCGANCLFPETAWSLVRILQKFGVTVVVPKDQVCCGLPAFVSGDTKKAQALAKRNLEAFKGLDLDAVVTVCASCGSHLEGLEALFDDDSSWQGRARALANKHRDAMAFLVGDVGFEDYLKGRKDAEEDRSDDILRVAYHDPCHLRIGQGITNAPRKFLGALPGVELAEAPHKDLCCGHGGDFNLSHFDLSMDILDRRMKDFKKVAPDVIVTGCTGCLIQFAEGVSRCGLAGTTQVLHPLVLAERALVSSRLM